jgi:uncharacterized membrane protein
MKEKLRNIVLTNRSLIFLMVCLTGAIYFYLVVTDSLVQGLALAFCMFWYGGHCYNLMDTIYYRKQEDFEKDAVYCVAVSVTGLIRIPIELFYYWTCSDGGAAFHQAVYYIRMASAFMSALLFVRISYTLVRKGALRK